MIVGMDVIGRNASSDEGSYFRANNATWSYIQTVMQAANVDVPFEWSENAGHGAATQDDCDAIADKVEQFLETNPTIIYNESPEDRSWNDFYVGLVAQVGRPNLVAQVGRPNTAKVSDWIRFLRTCGGFKVC